MVFLVPIYLVTSLTDDIGRPCSLWSCKGTTTRSPMQKLFLLPLSLGSILCGYICKYLTTPFIRPLMYSFMDWEYSGLRILYLIGYNRWLSLLLMLNLFPSWPSGYSLKTTSVSCSHIPIVPWALPHFLAEDVPGSYCTSSIQTEISLFFPKRFFLLLLILDH